MAENGIASIASAAASSTAADDYYRFAAERGHPEAKRNRARCMRLLG
jgi:TPR repeat protein